MISAAGTRTSNAFQIPQQDSSAPATPNRAKSIRSIPLVPTTVESSPTSVLVDVTADFSVGISELKGIQGYSNQLLLPEAMVYGNDLIKVWSIDDEQMVGEESQSMTIQLQEDPTYNKASMNPARLDSPKEISKDAITTITNPVSTVGDQMDSSSSSDMDDLFLALLSNTIALPPRLSPAPFSLPTTISLPRQLFLPLSPLSPHRSVRRSSGNANTIDLESIERSLDQDISEPEATTTRSKPSRGHRRGHRRNQSHFDFNFS